MSDATDHAIREGILAAAETVFGTKVKCEPTWMAAAVEEIRQRLPAHDALSDDVLSILDAEFRTRVKHELIELGEGVRNAGLHRPPMVLSDHIAEWSEVLDRISTALYHFVEDKDVLMGLHFISMTGSQWSDIVEAARDAKEGTSGGD